MRRLTPLLAGLTLLAACGRDAEEPGAATAPVETVAATVSDELPGLPAPAAGVDFWDHPTLPFNGLMIVATGAGVYAYNMEDGNPAAQIEDIAAGGVAVSYLGLGSDAAGFAAVYDAQANTFRFFGVDNVSRAFLPLNEGPAMRDGVAGFCMGRALSAAAPSLFVIQDKTIAVYNLAGDGDGVRIDSESAIGTPGGVVSCAVDTDGVLLAAADNGAIYRISGDNAFARPFARAAGVTSGRLAVISASGEGAESSGNGQILFADLSSGVIHVFDRSTGDAQGAIKFEATEFTAGIDGGEAFGATAANLGALYRNGAVAFGVAAGADGPVVRLAPASSLKNPLGIPEGEPVSPRGATPNAVDDALDIPTTYDPGE